MANEKGKELTNRPVRGKIPKIIKYGLEDETIDLLKKGYTCKNIADILNTEYAEKIPDDDLINYLNVYRYVEKIPEIKKELIKKDRRRIIKLVNENIDTIHETNVLYHRTKKVLDILEEQADSDDGIPNPHHYKAVVSELREFLKMNIELQKEIKDYEAVKMFMDIVLNTVQKHAPEALPKILDAIKSTKVSWVARQYENTHNVNNEEDKDVYEYGEGSEGSEDDDFIDV